MSNQLLPRNINSTLFVCLYNCNNQSEPASRFGMFATTGPSLKLFFFVIIDNDIRGKLCREKRENGFPIYQLIESANKNLIVNLSEILIGIGWQSRQI